jgi:hypothetical protein
VLFCLGGWAVSARAWSEFGTSDKKGDDAAVREGPEIREPFFEFMLGMAEVDSLGSWQGAELRAHTLATGRESRFPLDEVVSLERSRPAAAAVRKYPGATVRAVWTLTLTEDQDRAMPYSILGYHPGSLRVAGRLVFSELAPSDVAISYVEDDVQVTRHLTEVRIFPLEEGHVVLDADGWLDALLGSGLDDAWTLGFVVGREEGRLVGLGVSLGRKGRKIYGEFDFNRDKVEAHGRPVMAGLSRASRRWLNVEDGNLPPAWDEE